MANSDEEGTSLAVILDATFLRLGRLHCRSREPNTSKGTNNEEKATKSLIMAARSDI